jgi:protein gp37
MGLTKIEWTEQNWNPTRGCSVTSPGCTNCYAMRQAHRFSGEGKPYEGLTKLTGAGPQWTGEVRLSPRHILEAPLRRRKPTTYFVNSMSDLFHESLSNEEIAAVFGVMAAAPRHTFQVLTKRAERMGEWFEWMRQTAKAWGAESAEIPPCDIRVHFAAHCASQVISYDGEVGPLPVTWPPTNVWLGVSVEDQKRAAERIPHLLKTPAAVRFLSCEPLLGHLQLDVVRLDDFASVNVLTGERSYAGRGGSPGRDVAGGPRVDWVIVGAESGNGARPMDLTWARRIVDDCKEAGVSAFVKQLGQQPVARRGVEAFAAFTEEAKRAYPHPPDELLIRLKLKDRKGGDPTEWPEDLRVREVPTPGGIER